MPGLLDSLRSLFDGLNLDAEVNVQVGGLGALTGSVQALISGPQALTDLRTAISSARTPPGLEGLVSLTTSLQSLSLPSAANLAAALGPVLTPITGINVQVTGNVTGSVTAAFDIVREIIRIVTGQAPGGPGGLPNGDGFRLPDPVDPEELRRAMRDLDAQLDALGETFDAARILALLQQAAPAFNEPRFWLPQIPVLDDTMEALGTVASWQSMSAAELTDHLAATISRVAVLLRTPRVRVAQPVIDAAATIATAPETLGLLLTEAAPVFGRVREKILTGRGQPIFRELETIERATAFAETLAGALDPGTSPLAQHGTVDEELTRALLAVIRALEPASDVGPVARAIRDRIASLPSAPPAILDDLVTEVENFDLSAVTGPLSAVRDAVSDAVDAATGARQSVRDGLEAVLDPVADALDAAMAAARLEDVRAAIEGMQATIEGFVDTQVRPSIDAVRTAVGAAVDAVSDAAEQFNPQALIAPIRDAVQQAAALLRNEDVRRVFAELDGALSSAIQAIESINLAGAADGSIEIMGGIERTLAAIDPATIPDAAKPTLRQAVSVVTDIDFTAEVGGPVLDAIGEAVQQGPVAALGAVEASMDELKTSLESFRPSQVIGTALDEPFEALSQTLGRFEPSDLLDQLQEALDGLADRLQVLDVDAALDPIVGAYEQVRAAIDALRPSELLRPVEEAIQSAIARVYEASGIDTALAGVGEIFDTIQEWLDFLTLMRDVLSKAASKLGPADDASATVTALVDDVLARLDTVDMAPLRTAFADAALAATDIQRDPLARDVASALGRAGEVGPRLLASAPLADLTRMVRSFPLDELAAYPTSPIRDRLIATIERARGAVDRIERARSAWPELGPALTDAAGQVQEKLLDYYRVSQIEGASLFSEFLTPPSTAAELKEAVRAALDDAVREPLMTVLAGFSLASPYVRLIADDIARLLGALHAKLDSIIGGGGIGGIVHAIEEAADLLRNFDLTPISQPLDAVYGRIETAVDALDPEPLRGALNAVSDAVVDLLNLANVIDPADVEQLDAAWAVAVSAIGDLAPSKVISQTLDPEYESLLAEFLPVLEMPGRLRRAIEAVGRDLVPEATRELARVEEAFDRMLRALRLDDTGGPSASVSVSASASVG